MLKFQNFGHPPPPASPAFWPSFLGPWADNLNSAPNIFLPPPPGSEKVWPDHPVLKLWEEIDLAEKSVFGVPGLTTRAPGSKLHAQKFLARSSFDPEKLTTMWLWGQKLFYMVVVTDRQTDRQTDTHFESPWTPKGKNFPYTILCMEGWETSNPAKFLPLHFVKLASLTSPVKENRLHSILIFIV